MSTLLCAVLLANTKRLNSLLPILLPLIRNRRPHTITNIHRPTTLTPTLQLLPDILRALGCQEPRPRTEIVRLVVTQQVQQVGGAVRDLGQLGFQGGQGCGIFFVVGGGLHVSCCHHQALASIQTQNRAYKK